MLFVITPKKLCVSLVYRKNPSNRSEHVEFNKQCFFDAVHALESREKNNLFKGHMDNINRLAKDGKLVMAGPFMENNRNYRDVYIFNVSTVEEANALVISDPAVKENLLEAELTLWYGSAALQETLKIHEKIAKTKI